MIGIDKKTYSESEAYNYLKLNSNNNKIKVLYVNLSKIFNWKIKEVYEFINSMLHKGHIKMKVANNGYLELEFID